MTPTNVISITFKKDNLKHTVFMKEEDAFEMINNDPVLTKEMFDARTGESLVPSEKIIQALEIKTSGK